MKLRWLNLLKIVNNAMQHSHQTSLTCGNCLIQIQMNMFLGIEKFLILQSDDFQRIISDILNDFTVWKKWFCHCNEIWDFFHIVWQFEKQIADEKINSAQPECSVWEWTIQHLFDGMGNSFILLDILLEEREYDLVRTQQLLFVIAY